MGHTSFHLYYKKIAHIIQEKKEKVMITTSDINTILGIKETFQLHGALKDVIFNEEKYLDAFKDAKQIHLDRMFI